jgi:hypothetical protein
LSTNPLLTDPTAAPPPNPFLFHTVDTNHFITNGGIYRADGTPKAAGTVVETLITSTWNTSSPAVPITPSPANPALKSFRGFYGRYDITVTVSDAQGVPATFVQRVNFASAAGPAQTVVMTLPVAAPAPVGGGGRRLLQKLPRWLRLA